MYYEKLRSLLCEIEEIKEDLYAWISSTQKWEIFYDIELRHILWYMKNNEIQFQDNKKVIKIILLCNFSKPLSEQEESCEKIYNYLITI